MITAKPPKAPPPGEVQRTSAARRRRPKDNNDQLEVSFNRHKNMPRPKKRTVSNVSTLGLSQLISELSARYRHMRNNPFRRSSDMLGSIRSEVFEYIRNDMGYNLYQAHRLFRRVSYLLTDSRSSSLAYVEDIVKYGNDILNERSDGEYSS